MWFFFKLCTVKGVLGALLSNCLTQSWYIGFGSFSTKHMILFFIPAVKDSAGTFLESIFGKLKKS